MLLVCVYLLLLLLLILAFKYPDRAIGTRARPDLQGPRGWPIIGNLLTGIKRGPRGLEWSAVSLAEYGPGFTGTVPGLRFIDISTRPDWLEHTQRTNFQNYVKGSKFQENNSDVLGQGIFNVDGSNWHLQRKVTSRIFTAASFRDLITPAIKTDLEALDVFVLENVKNETPFDLQDTFFRFTLQNFTRIAFSTNIDALVPGSPAVPFARAFDFAQKVLLDRIFNPFWKVTERFTSTGRQMRESVEIVSKYAYDIIETRKNEKRDEDKREQDLLDLYMSIRDENGEPLSNVQLRDSVVNLLIAGRDTTAQALAWSFFRLIRDPTLQEPLLKEINTVLADATSVDSDSLKMLIEVQAVLHESLRLHPSIPKNMKQALADDQLPNGGPKIYAGEFVRWGDWLLGRSEELWGSDARVYRPSRWIDEDTGQLIKPGPWKAHFFNGGPRQCLGLNLAMLEMASVLCHLLGKYELSFASGWYNGVEKTSGVANVEEDPSPLYGPSLSLPMKHPFMVVASLRS